MKRTLKCINRLIWLLLTINIFLIACTTTAPPSTPGVKMPWKNRQGSLQQIHSWNLSGKIGVQTAKDAGSASVKWTQSQDRYTLSLMGPLGAGAMTLKGQPGHVVLTTADGKTFTSDSAEDLLAERWGFKLPVAYLNYWVRGMPVPNIPAVTHFDEYNRLTSLQQQGWDVQYLGYTKTTMSDLPNHITISSPSLKVKIIISSWQVA